MHANNRLCLAASLIYGLAFGGIGLCGVRPTGTKVGLVQFDAVIELTSQVLFVNSVVFARYWVCPEYYAFAVVWTEPGGESVLNVKHVAVLSDANAFHHTDPLFPNVDRLNTAYPRPIGKRGPFKWTGGPYSSDELRFAEREALARRLYAQDLNEIDPDGQVTVKVRSSHAERSLSKLKLQTEAGMLRQLELFDAADEPLCQLKYEYDLPPNENPKIHKLIAELPARPEPVAVNQQLPVFQPGAPPRRQFVSELRYVYHKGGRTATVTYEDVQFKGRQLRLPVRIDVCITATGMPLRSARLYNFRQVQMTKQQVWDAARALAAVDPQYSTYRALAKRYLPEGIRPMRKSLVTIDPNDIAAIEALIAKYPVPEPLPSLHDRADISKLSHEEILILQRQHIEDLNRRKAQPGPPKLLIEPNDLRNIRYLQICYQKEAVALTRQLHDMAGRVPEEVQKRHAQVDRIHRALNRITTYHRKTTLPEDLPPELDSNDLAAIGQLKAYYSQRLDDDSAHIGRRFQASSILMRLDMISKDWAAFEQHLARHIRMLADQQLHKMSLDCGSIAMAVLTEAGQYKVANRVLANWTRHCLHNCEPNDILYFAASSLKAKRNPWALLSLADGLLKRQGLSQIQRYGALASRAICLNYVDQILANADQEDDIRQKATAQWVLSTVSRQQVTRDLDPAVQQAVRAWQSLGPAALDKAKPYSGSAEATLLPEPARQMIDPTPLQELSAMLDQIVRQRSTRAGQQPGATQPGPIQPGTRQPGARQSIPRQPLQRR